MAKSFIKFINKLSGVKETIDNKGHPRTCRQEIYLFTRIQFFCNLRGAIARENAFLQLKPMKDMGYRIFRILDISNNTSIFYTT